MEIFSFVSYKKSLFLYKKCLLQKDNLYLVGFQSSSWVSLFLKNN